VGAWVDNESVGATLVASRSSHRKVASQVDESDSEHGELDDGQKTGKQNWPTHSLQIRNRLSMPIDSTPWSAEHSLTGVSKSNLRRVDCCDVAYWAYLVRHDDLSSRTSCPPWWADLSQGVERKSWGELVPSFNQDSLPYSFEVDRVMSAEDRSALLETRFCWLFAGDALFSAGFGRHGGGRS
jgi:hypothetical protein